MYKIPIVEKDMSPTPEGDTEPCVSEHDSFILSSYKNENQKLKKELEKMKAIMKAREAAIG